MAELMTIDKVQEEMESKRITMSDGRVLTIGQVAELGMECLQKLADTFTEEEHELSQDCFRLLLKYSWDEFCSR